MTFAIISGGRGVIEQLCDGQSGQGNGPKKRASACSAGAVDFTIRLRRMA
jgi:hypothetical protein